MKTGAEAASVIRINERLGELIGTVDNIALRAKSITEFLTRLMRRIQEIFPCGDAPLGAIVVADLELVASFPSPPREIFSKASHGNANVRGLEDALTIPA
ncbi:MAG: hypothetical protein ACREBD_16970 [Blastocatellia bacterium]